MNRLLSTETDSLLLSVRDTLFEAVQRCGPVTHPDTNGADLDAVRRALQHEAKRVIEEVVEVIAANGFEAVPCRLMGGDLSGRLRLMACGDDAISMVKPQHIGAKVVLVLTHPEKFHREQTEMKF